jgi:hypothetical protein
MFKKWRLLQFIFWKDHFSPRSAGKAEISEAAIKTVNELMNIDKGWKDETFHPFDPDVNKSYCVVPAGPESGAPPVSAGIAAAPVMGAAAPDGGGVMPPGAAPSDALAPIVPGLMAPLPLIGGASVAAWGAASEPAEDDEVALINPSLFIVSAFTVPVTRRPFAAWYLRRAAVSLALQWPLASPFR